MLTLPRPWKSGPAITRSRRIRRGEYSLWLPSYSQGLPTGYGLGLPGLLCPRIETHANKDPEFWLWGLRQTIKVFTFRACGRWGHSTGQEAMLDPCPYGRKWSFENRAHHQGSLKPWCL